MKDRHQDTIALVLESLSSLSTEISSGGQLVARVAAESGLHPHSTGAALSKWVETITAASLEALVASATRPFGGIVTTLAPGNVPVVAAEALLLGLMAGVKHNIALSRRSMALPERLFEILRSLDRTVEDHVGLHPWRSLSLEARRNLLDASRVVAFGTAVTIEWIASRVSPLTVVVPHGPTVTVAYLNAKQTGADELRPLLRRLAFDVALYDQRGCRSPHAALVLGTDEEARNIAKLLGDELEKLSNELPRGVLTPEESTALFLDALTSSSLGTVFQGSTWRVTLEIGAEIVRPSPLGRTLRVLGLRSEDSLYSLLATLPAPVGLLLTPDGAAPRGTSQDAAWSSLPFGRSQCSPFDRLHDGRHRLDELLSECRR